MGEGFLPHVSGSLAPCPSHSATGNPAQQGGRRELTLHSLPEGLSLVVSMHSTGLPATGAINQFHRNPVRARSSEPPEVTFLNRHLLANGLFLHLRMETVYLKHNRCRVPHTPEACDHPHVHSVPGTLQS